MDHPATGLSSLGTWLRLGRVSNLPTVWSNVLAGACLAGLDSSWALALLLPAVSLFYVAGMFLNDACDVRIDAMERPERPIPSGQVTRVAVAGAAVAMMAAGFALISPLGLAAQGCAVGLCVTIVAYDLYHKGNPLSPVVMGACRAGVYLLAAAAIMGNLWGGIDLAGWAALALLAYVAGLTYAARQENMAQFENAWPLAMLALPVLYLATCANAPALAFLLAFVIWLAHGLRLLLVPTARDIRRAVGALIAGISLFDATVIANAGHPLIALVAVGAFGLTLAAHRKVAGT
jgi:4-hydroxybenzoate polyprenyltransferase